MIGVNVLHLNELTVVAALQEYLDKRYSEGVDPGVKVKGVTYEKDYTSEKFVVVIEGRKP